MNYITELIIKLNFLIAKNNIIVKKGSNNSLEKKFFYITNDMDNYIKEVLYHNKEDIKQKLKVCNKIKVIDLFAGGGLFTLMYCRSLLTLLQEEQIEIEKFNIVLNDKLNKNIIYLGIDNLRSNYKDIINNYKKYPEIIKLFNIDMKIKDEENINMLNDEICDNSFNIIIANPMITKKRTDTVNELIFTSEELLLSNDMFSYVINNIILKTDLFIYLTNQENSKLNINSHKNKTIYINNYEKLLINEIDKNRYEIFEFEDLEEMKEENFWKFTNHQKENFNKIILFKKGESSEITFRYVYNKIYDDFEEMKIKGNIDNIKSNLDAISIEEIINKYELLKGNL